MTSRMGKSDSESGKQVARSGSVTLSGRSSVPMKACVSQHHFNYGIYRGFLRTTMVRNGPSHCRFASR
ncbi:hypothetical protein J6590_030480 [Homalodisca vitripennis]|nr:hypothetical protein J6590_030480 [Homalodisca vitripennis]